MHPFLVFRTTIRWLQLSLSSVSSPHRSSRRLLQSLVPQFQITGAAFNEVHAFKIVRVKSEPSALVMYSLFARYHSRDVTTIA